MEGREAKAEDWCFVCKDGGDLILCNHGNCSKVYHLECLGFDCQSSSQIEEHWSCDCHSCSSCEGASEVHCFCCPASFCKNCIKSVKFIPLRPNKGLCADSGPSFVLRKNFPSPRKLWISKTEIHTSAFSKSIGIL